MMLKYMLFHQSSINVISPIFALYFYFLNDHNDLLDKNFVQKVANLLHFATHH